jgi:hypothetical protein
MGRQLWQEIWHKNSPLVYDWTLLRHCTRKRPRPELIPYTNLSCLKIRILMLFVAKSPGSENHSRLRATSFQLDDTCWDRWSLFWRWAANPLWGKLHRSFFHDNLETRDFGLVSRATVLRFLSPCDRKNPPEFSKRQVQSQADSDCNPLESPVTVILRLILTKLSLLLGSRTWK